MLNTLIESYGFGRIQELRGLLNFLLQAGYDIYDFLCDVDERIETTRKTQQENYEATLKQIEAFMPKCPACESTLFLREAESIEHESVLFCGCGYRYHNDISITDHVMVIEAARNGVTPDFEIDEIRASPEERKRRRAVCKACDQLTPRNTCKACGCRMKHRTYYEILTCPKKFW